jgi:hypothetical protein
VAHVLRAESRADGLTDVSIATSVSRIIHVLIPTPTWYQLTADTLDQVVQLAIAEQRPTVRRR